MRAHITAATHMGRVRRENQDCLLVDGWVAQRSGSILSTVVEVSAQPITIAVLDGLGGHTDGALAARTAALQLAEQRLAPDDSGGVCAALQLVNRAVIDTGRSIHGHADLGTTVAGLVLTGETGLAFNIGDSRVYQLVDGYLGQLTVDDRRPSPIGPGWLLTQSLGGPIERALHPHPQPIEVGTAARYLLCTDGLHDVLTPEEILQASLRPPGPPAPGQDPGDSVTVVVQRLLRAALEGGAPDNVSVIGIDLRA